MAAAGGFALIGFPLDDLWHRLFGQDVTLWGPTHLMLIGGASVSLIGQGVLLAEGTRTQGILQGEFDFGVPQFRLLFHPILIAFAAGIALVAARIYAGRGAALGLPTLPSTSRTA